MLLYLLSHLPICLKGRELWNVIWYCITCKTVWGMPLCGPPSEMELCGWTGALPEAFPSAAGPVPGHGAEQHRAIYGHPCMKKVSSCSLAVSRGDDGPTAAKLLCSTWSTSPVLNLLLAWSLSCSAPVQCGLSVLPPQLSSLLCPYIYLLSVVGHVTEGFNLFTALLLVIYPLYSLLSCII